MRPAVRLLLAALLGLTVLAPTAAHAEKKTFIDDRGDVQTYTLDENDTEDARPTPNPSRTKAGDILRTAISNTGNRISVKVRYAVLGRRVLFNESTFVIVGSNGQRHSLYISHDFEPEGTALLTRSGQLKCGKTLRHRIDYRADTLSFSFPRSCIGSPRRIRIAHAHAWAKPQDDETALVAYDIAGRDGGNLDRRWGFSGPVRYSR